MIRLGPLLLESPLILAPMAGYTDSVQRALCHRHGAALCYTEVISTDGLNHQSARTRHMLCVAADEGPLVAHLYGNNPDALARAAAEITRMNRFCAIDLNCGCPVRKIVSKGSGAALMRDPALIIKIITAMRQHTDLPLFVKTRIGISPEVPNGIELAQAAEAGGAALIAVHARFASDHHGGPPNLTLLAEVKRSVSIPVVGNGGMRTISDLNAMQASGVDAFMIARGAIGNPWIFEQLTRQLAGLPPREIPLEEISRTLYEHIRRVQELKTEERTLHRKPAKLSTELATVRHFRTYLFRYLSGLRGAPEVRRNLSNMHTFDDIRRAVDEVMRQTRPHPKRVSIGSVQSPG